MNMRVALAVAGLSLSLLACSKVTPGHVGVRVNNLGSNAGVENTALGVGWYWTGFGQHIYEYPVFTSTL